MEITKENDVYNIFAEFLIQLNKAEKRDFISIDKNRLIKQYTQQLNDMNEKTRNIKISVLNNIYQKLLKKQLIDKLCFLIAYDRKHKMNSAFIKGVGGTLNTNNSEIEIYPIFEKKILHEKSYNDSLSCFFENISFVFKNECKYKINNIYIDNFIEKNSFKVGFIPYSSHYMRKFRVSHRLKKKITPNKLLNYNIKDDEHLVEEIDYLSSEKADLILCPETLPNYEEKLTDNQMKKITNSLNRNNSILFGPATYFIKRNVTSEALLIFNNTTSRIKKVYKYFDKRNGINSVGYEAIKEGDSLNVVRLKNFGSILLLICSDYFIPSLNQIIRDLDVDCIAIISATTSYNAFRSDCAKALNDGRLLVQCNLCNDCFEHDKKNRHRITSDKQIISPVNIVLKDRTISDEYLCDKKYCDCAKCDKHFEVSFKIEDRKIKLNERK